MTVYEQMDINESIVISLMSIDFTIQNKDAIFHAKLT